MEEIKKIRKLGAGSKSVIIPSYMAKKLGLEYNQEVKITLKGNKLIIEKIEV